MERHHSPLLATGLAIALSLSDDTGQDKAAGRIQLFPAGTFAARDGRPGNLRGVNATSWRLTAQDAEAVIAHWQRTATPLVVDYEHQTQLAAQNGQPAPAAGWITSLEWEEGRGLFAGVDWTDKARAHIRAGEYRYISPVFAFDRQSGAVLRLICAALTNHPALDGMDAASATFTPYEEPPMKQILAALGLPETADEAAALAALTTLRQERDSAKAQAEGCFDDQIIPITVPGPDGKDVVITKDEGIRPGCNIESLSQLKPCFLENGSVTAATSSQMTDGAGFVVLMSKEKAEALGVRPLARFVGFAVDGVPARIMGVGPIKAIPKVLKLTGLGFFFMLSHFHLLELKTGLTGGIR